jgi:hypothetical protein
MVTPPRKLPSQETDAVRDRIFRGFAVGLGLAAIGFAVAWLAPEPRVSHPLMLLGWCIGMIGILGGGLAVVLGIAHDIAKSKVDRET